jgi:hypothetical protein
MNTRNRRSSEYIGYGPYFYFSGLSLKNIRKIIVLFYKEKSCISVELDTKSINPKKMFERKKKIEEFIIE